jgi:hypothetical protein
MEPADSPKRVLPSGPNRYGSAVGCTRGNTADKQSRPQPGRRGKRCGSLCGKLPHGGRPSTGGTRVASATDRSFRSWVGVCPRMPPPGSPLLPGHTALNTTCVRPLSPLVERAGVEDRRRTQVRPHLWPEGSLGHLAYGVLSRVSERWGQKCVREVAQPQIRRLRARRHLDEQEVEYERNLSPCTDP